MQTSVDTYTAEIALARSALGSPRDAAAAWRSGWFDNSMISDIGCAVLAACFVWDERGHRWDDRDALVLLVIKSLRVGDAWIEESAAPADVAWYSPLWGISQIAAGISAMRNPAASAAAWSTAFQAWLGSVDSEAA